MDIQDFTKEFIKQADRMAASGSAAILGPFSGLLADEGHGWRTAGGATLGGLTGAAIGGLKYGGPLSMAGSSLGAYLAHGKKKRKRRK